MKAVWAFIKEVPELLKYFPNWDKDELPDRFFMWTILSKLRHDKWKQLINEARNARSKKDKQNHDELIKIDSEFLDKHIATPILSTGKQITSRILKILDREGKSCIPFKIRKIRKNLQERSQKNIRVILQFWSQIKRMNLFPEKEATCMKRKRRKRVTRWI